MSNKDAFVPRLREAIGSRDMKPGLVEIELPCSEQDITETEARAGIRFPPSYCSFLLESNGLYVTPDDDATALQLLSIAGVAEQTRRFLADLPANQQLLVCGFGPESDWIVLNPAFGDGAEYSVHVSMIASSFGEFLERVVASIAGGSELGALLARITIAVRR